MPDAEVGGGHRHDNSLAEVVLIDELSALIGRHRNHPGDGGRGRRDVARALPHSRQFAELIRIGDDQEVPGLAVRRRRRSPTGLGTVRCDCASLAGGLTPCLRLCGAGRGHSPVAVRPFRACFSLRELHAAAKPQFSPHECDNPVCVKVSGPGALCEHVVAGTQFDNMRRMARARRGGGRPTIRGLGREARRARSVALREAVQGGVWDASDAVANALLGVEPRLF